MKRNRKHRWDGAPFFGGRNHFNDYSQYERQNAGDQGGEENDRPFYDPVHGFGGPGSQEDGNRQHAGSSQQGRPQEDYQAYYDPIRGYVSQHARPRYDDPSDDHRYIQSDNYGHQGNGSRRDDARDRNDFASNRFRQEDPGHSGYDPQRRESRSFWDQATDAVSSFFGTNNAHRRDMEQQHGDSRRNEGNRYEQSAWGVMANTTGGGYSGSGDSSRSHRGKGPKNYMRSDARILEEVCDRLCDAPHLDASDIEVAVTNGEVVLSGRVSDRFAKRHAVDLAESVSGVSNVENRIRVQGDSGEKTA